MRLTKHLRRGENRPSSIVDRLPVIAATYPVEAFERPVATVVDPGALDAERQHRTQAEEGLLARAAYRAGLARPELCESLHTDNTR